ncbi:DUF2987 domain-containing protein [Niveispirillum lacus]|nr:DUF2987 domain-containing protein [Niveispirillum lacus]
MRKAGFILLPLLLSAPTLAAPGTHTVPYKEFFDQMARFYGQDNDRLVLRLSVQPAKDTEPLDVPVTMSVTINGQTQPITLDAHNAVALDYRPDWVEQGAMVTINQARETYVMRAQIGMKMPSGTQTLRYAEVQAAFDQFNRLIEKEAGMVSFLAPSAKTLRVFCGPACTVTLKGDKGSKDLTPDDKGRVNIANDKALMRQYPDIVISNPVAYTVLTTKG